MEFNVIGAKILWKYKHFLMLKNRIKYVYLLLISNRPNNKNECK